MGTIAIILEHTRLAREYAQLPRNADTPEAYAQIEQRKRQIEARIEELKEIERKWQR